VQVLHERCSLKVPLPVAHALVGATIAVAILPREMPRRVRAIALGAALAVAPDLDFSAPWLLHLGHDWHRGFTHSVFFALLVTALMHVYYKAARWRETLSAGLALLSHGLLDSVTTDSDRGVALLWPFSSQRISLGWFPIDGYFFTDGALYDNVLRMFLELAQELIIFLPFLILALLLRRWWNDGAISPWYSARPANRRRNPLK
jgi:membrane-bound metal-dependent hydrolase YbcI (DUF457 family)